MRGWDRRPRAAGREIPVIHQHSENDCGPTALAMVAAYHGILVDVEVLTVELALKQDGTDLLTLSRAARRLGFRTEGVRASYDMIAKCTLPAIAHMRSSAGHFVVLHRWSPGYVVVADPALGICKLSRKAFSRRATGYVLLVDQYSIDIPDAMPESKGRPTGTWDSLSTFCAGMSANLWRIFGLYKVPIGK